MVINIAMCAVRSHFGSAVTECCMKWYTAVASCLVHCEQTMQNVSLSGCTVLLWEWLPSGSATANQGVYLLQWCLVWLCTSSQMQPQFLNGTMHCNMMTNVVHLNSQWLKCWLIWISMSWSVQFQYNSDTDIWLHTRLLIFCLFYIQSLSLIDLCAVDGELLDTEQLLDG